MGTMIFDDFTSELNFLLGNPNDIGATNAARTGRWINQAYTYMCHPSVHHFREMQEIDNSTVLASGTNSYVIETLGSNTVVSIRFVSHVAASSYTPTAVRQKLSPRGIRWFEERALSVGRPFLYTIDGSSLYVSGVPGSTENGQLLRIGFYKEPSPLSTGEATVLGAYYDRPLLKFVQAFALADLGDRASALVVLREATQLVNNASAESEMEAEDTGFHTEFVLHPAMGF